MIFNSIGAVLSIFFMIGVGVFVYYKKWTDRKNASMLAKIVVNIAVPANVLYSFLNNFNRSIIAESGLYILIGFVSMIVTYYFSRLVIALFKIEKGRRGLFAIMFSFSNSVFIGFPVARALFGESAMLYAVLFYLVNTIMFWTFGYMGIRADGEGEQKVGFLEILKKLVNVPMISIVLAFALILLEVKLSSNAMNTLKYMSNMTTPLSMIFTGIVLADMGLSKLKFEKSLILVFVGRVLIAPAIMLLIAMMFGVQGLGRQVFIMQSTLPIMLQSVIMAENYGADSNYATKAFAWTTIFSVISIPIYMWLLSTFI